MLEEEVHFDTDAANVFEHVGELHVVRVGAEAVESNSNVSLIGGNPKERGSYMS